MIKANKNKDKKCRFGFFFWLASTIIFSLFLGRPVFLSAQSVSLSELDQRISRGACLDDLIFYARRKNADIQAAKAKWKAEEKKYALQTGYPDPQISLNYFVEPIETRLGPQNWNLGFFQTIPFPGKLSKIGELVKAESRVQQARLNKSELEIISSVSRSYYELYYLRTARQIVRLQTILLERLRKTAETAYAQERTLFIDVIKAQAQAGQLSYDALLLSDLEQVEIAKLNALLNRPPEAKIGTLNQTVLPSLDFQLEEIYRLAEAGREEILMADLEIEKSALREDLARFQSLPDFKLGLFYSSIGNPETPSPPSDAAKDALGIQFGFSLPLWINKNAARAQKARIETSMNKSAKLAEMNKTRAEISYLYFRLKNSERLALLYQKELLPQARKSMETMDNWFQEGEAAFSDLLEAKSVWYNFQLSLVRAQADYGKYYARLERVAGATLSNSAKQKKPELGKELPEKEDNFEKIKKRLSELKSRWEESLSKRTSANSFFQPSLKSLAMFRSIAADKEKTILKLENASPESVRSALEMLTYLRNQEIKSKESHLKAALENFSQVSNLDEILRQYSAFTQSLMLGAGPDKGKDPTKLKFPFPGITALKGEVARQSVKSAFEDLEIARRDAVTDIRKAYCELVFIRKSRNIIQKTLDLLSDLESVAAARYESGKTGFQDAIKIRVQNKTLAEELITLREREKNYNSQILELLDLPMTDLKLKVPSEVKFPSSAPPAEELYKSVLKNRQELKRLELMIGKMERMIEMTETMTTPGYSLNLSFYKNNPPQAEAPRGAFSPSGAEPLSRPRMVWRGIDDPYLRQTRQKLTALKKQLKKAQAAAVTNARRKWFQLDKAVREIKLYQQTVLPLYQSALEVSIQGYKTGKASFSDLINSYSLLLQAGLTLAEKQSRAAVALAELSQAAGRDIARTEQTNIIP